MKFLIVLLATIYAAQALTVQECGEKAKKCKQYMAPLARGGHSREQLIRAIRTTPFADICNAAQQFIQCGKAILDDPECNIHPQVTQFTPLHQRFEMVKQFICDRESAAVQRAIPCLTSRQFFNKIASCKRRYACNSDDSWNCAKNAVASTCDTATSTWFESYIPMFRRNHPGCGEDNLMKKFYGHMRA